MLPSFGSMKASGTVSSSFARTSEHKNTDNTNNTSVLFIITIVDWGNGCQGEMRAFIFVFVRVLQQE